MNKGQHVRPRIAAAYMSPDVRMPYLPTTALPGGGHPSLERTPEGMVGTIENSG